MKKANTVWYYSLILAFALSSNLLAAPAHAETCMTDSLMMVYEPVEPFRVKPKNAKKHRIVAVHQKVQTSQKRQHSYETIVHAAAKPTSDKQVAAGKETRGANGGGGAT